ncbi:MAG: MBL fold metallo-hydrolase [Candidatus Methanomethylicia archaeon]
MKIIPIAFESLGVRSMCTFIETKDIRLMIDPGMSLGLRYGKMPHPKEYKSLIKARKRMYKEAEKADLIIITHYHIDHYTQLKITDYMWTWSDPENAEKLYEGKNILLKDYKNNINLNQKRRGWIHWKLLNKIECKVEIADNKTININNTRIRISKPIPHGEEYSKLGYVLMVEIEEEDEKVLYTSDIQGPQTLKLTNEIMMLKPNITIIGGPTTYIATEKKKVTEIIDNIKTLKNNIPKIILDHHILRDKDWRKYFNKIREKGENKVQTAAEYMGGRNKTLECIRDLLYEKYEPSKEFLKWCKSINKHRGKEPPPI